MPWKIVNLDFACDRPHLHIKDPASPIHLRAYFDEKRVEIALGADDPDECFVRATVTREAVVARATRFERLHVRILASILAALDVEPHERDGALAWMNDRIARDECDDRGWLLGNVDEFPPPEGWPYDLDDDALLDSVDDPGEIPGPRRKALLREARRRGLRVALEGAGPEVFRRRGRE